MKAIKYIYALSLLPFFASAEVSNSESTAAKEANVAPVILTTRLDSAVQDEFYGSAILVNDADDDKLTFSFEGLPSGLSISKKGHVYGTPFEHGDFNVELIVSDGVNETRKTVSLYVEKAAFKAQLFDESMEVYPNPFKNNLIIKYTLKEDLFVDIRLYDSRGELIKTFVNGIETQGDKEIGWDAIDEKGKKLNREGWYIIQFHYYKDGELIYSENRRLFRLTRSQAGPMW